MARPIWTGSISFGLVTVPVRLYPAAVPRRVSFHMLHAKCGSRVRTQWFCPVDKVVSRDELVQFRRVIAHMTANLDRVMR